MQTAARGVVQTLPVDFLQTEDPDLHSNLSSYYAHGVRHRAVRMRGQVTVLDGVAREWHVRTPVMGPDGYRAESSRRVPERMLICNILAHDNHSRVGNFAYGVLL